MDQKDRKIAWITGFALAAGCLCCALWLLGSHFIWEMPLVLAGLALSAASAVLALLCWRVYRQARMELEQEWAAERESLEDFYEQELQKAHKEGLTAMETFRSDLSHSLRMPIAITQGYAELLACGVVTDSDVAREYLEKIIQRTHYMTEIMSRQFSAVETADDRTLVRSEVDLLELVRQAASDMQAAAMEQDVTIQVVTSEEGLVVLADAYLLNRALFNLLENALKYMGRPGTVTIRILRREGEVSITVRDDGLGLPAQEVDHIFDANYQGSNHKRGQGYGLYLVKRTMEAHGGTVSAQSSPGKGMGITLLLPVPRPV